MPRSRHHHKTEPSHKAGSSNKAGTTQTGGPLGGGPGHHAPHHPPGLERIAELGRAALSEIPEDLLRHCNGVVIRVADFAEQEVLDELGIDDPFGLLGLYQGIGLPFRSVSHSGTEPDMIWLYRRPILDYWCETGEHLADIVRHVLVHEIGHHFGFSDDDMDLIEQQD